ncbi:Very-long-chain enoyl-CoA reductase [Balamuthia mandrillaris]
MASSSATASVSSSSEDEKMPEEKEEDKGDLEDQLTPRPKKRKVKLGRSIADEYHAHTKTKPLLLNLQPKVEPNTGRSGSSGEVSLFAIYGLVPAGIPFLVVGLICSIIDGGLLPAFSILFGDLFNSPDTVKERVSFIATLFIGMGVATFILHYIYITCFALVGEKIARKLRIMLFDRMMHMDVAYMDKHQTGELTSKLSSDVLIAQGGISEKVAQVITNWAQLFVGVIIAFIYGWKMTLVLLAMAPVAILGGGIQAVAIKRSSKSSQKAYNLSTNIAEESLAGYRTIHSFVMENSMVATYDKSLREPTRLAKIRAHVLGAGLGFSYLSILSTYALGFWYGGTLVAEGEMEPGDLLTVFFSVIVGAMGMGQAGQLMPDISKGRAAAAAIFEIISQENRIDPHFGTGFRLEEGEKLKGIIELEDVTFCYPVRPDTKVFDGTSLRIEAGEHMALVGPSGSGKSTVVALVSRFYDVSGGAVKIDERPITEYDLYWLRKQIGLVSQEPILFSCSVEENIRFGKPDATEEEVINAAKAANAHTFISQLPDGYKTKTGERGCQMSGGQKQRIAIARAILKDPSILLLDEATSALDTESESLVQEALDTLMEGRTTIIIAHRLATVRDADCIAVMQKGVIVEKGSHAELLASSIIYNNLVQKQLAGDEKTRSKILLKKAKDSSGSNLNRKEGSSASMLSEHTRIKGADGSSSGESHRESDDESESESESESETASQSEKSKKEVESRKSESRSSEKEEESEAASTSSESEED